MCSTRRGGPRSTASTARTSSLSGTVRAFPCFLSGAWCKWATDGSLARACRLHCRAGGPGDLRQRQLRHSGCPLSASVPSPPADPEQSAPALPRRLCLGGESNRLLPFTPHRHPDAIRPPPRSAGSSGRPSSSSPSKGSSRATSPRASRSALGSAESSPTSPSRLFSPVRPGSRLTGSFSRSGSASRTAPPSDTGPLSNLITRSAPRYASFQAHSPP